MCSIVTFLIIIPSLLFFLALFSELELVYDNLNLQLARTEVSSQAPFANPIVSELWERVTRYLGVEGKTVKGALSWAADRVVRYLLDHYSVILGGIGVFLVNFFTMIFSMFFFFRDGDRLLEELRRLVPLAPEYQDRLVRKLREVIYATFFGVLATGACQGIAAGVVFFLLGISNPVLWGTTTAVVSVVPVIGTAVVWVPMSVYLILTGSVGKGVLLLVLGSGVIAVVDNVVRPLIIEGKSEGMHLLLVFFGLAGGLALFGPPGLILGPLVAALLVVFLDIFRSEFKEDLS
jgi:predicted PurR-regulated permease PerM